MQILESQGKLEEMATFCAGPVGVVLEKPSREERLKMESELRLKLKQWHLALPIFRNLLENFAT